ncbi:hypothetical protein HPB50_008167 [Hyalomma asiaticum]|uniref:Uncharacterized protein n=1 Tax=Hyalomma asiaticum TaxID=266040 RepID=A0ACB7S5K7_HYAAI|nr:hypothetical protein HPB50_008167 [Hyalomma asiaticum]
MNAGLASASGGRKSSRGFRSGLGLSGIFSSAQDTIVETVWKPLLCLGVVILLLASVVAFVLLTGEKSSETLRHCKRLMCKDPYEALGSLLNYSVKPCDDMYAHVCSPWTGGNTEHAGFLQESLDYYLTKMREIFERSDVNAVGEGLSDGLRTGGILFAQCLAAMKGQNVIEKDDIDFLKHRLLLTRIIGSKTAQEAVREGTEISFKFGLNAMLILRPQRLENTAVMYAFLGSAVKTYLPATADAKECVSAILTSMSIATDIETLSTAVVTQDRIVMAYQRRAKSAHKKIPVNRLREESPTLEALVASPMKRLARMSGLSEGYLLVRDYENVVSFIRLLTRSSGSNVAWYLVVQMLVDLFVFDYVERYEAKDKWHTLRACSGAVNKAMSHVWSSLGRQLMLNRTNHNPISDLFDNVRKELASNNSYLQEFLSGNAFSRLQKAVGGISCIMNHELLESQHKLVLRSAVLTPTHQSFVRSYVDVRQQTRSASLTWPPGVLWDLATLHEMEVTPIYREETNSMFLSTILEMPHVFYSDDAAHLLNYGVLGAALARELVGAVAPGASLDRAESLWSSEDTQQLLERLECYVDSAVANREGNTTNLKLEIFPWLVSVKIAYDALRKEFLLKKLDDSVWKIMQRQFFLRFCLAACQSPSAGLISARDKCIRPLSGNPAFVQAFDCPNASPMSHQPCKSPRSGGR